MDNTHQYLKKSNVIQRKKLEKKNLQTDYLDSQEE